MVAEEMLRVVAGRELEAGVVKVYHVGIPVVVTLLGQQRSVARHLHDVGVALYVAEVEGLGECRLVGAGARSILAHVDLRSAAVVVVVVVLVVNEPCGRLVVVLVNHVEEVAVLVGEVPALDVVGRGEVERPRRAAEQNLGMALVKLPGNHLAALLEDRGDDVFVADAEILQVERSRMACVGAHLRPLRRGGVAVGPFDEVREFVDVGGHLLHGDAALLTAEALAVGSRVLAGHAGCQHGQRLGTDVLAELEILQEAQSARLVVVPDVHVGLAVLPGAYGVLPVVDVVESLSVAHAAAGESHELRLQRGDGLSQVAAQAVALVGVLREERYHVEGSLSALLAHDAQLASLHVVVGEHGGLQALLLLVGVEHERIAMPALAFSLQPAFSHHRAVVGHEGHRELLLLAVLQAYVAREVVAGTLVDDAVPAAVQQRVGIHHHVVRIVLRQRFVGGQLHARRGLPCRQRIPAAMVAGRVFEVAVLHQFGIQPAVGGIADVLEEHADELVADGLLLRRVHAEPGLHPVGQRGEALGVVAHLLAVELVVLSQRVEPLADVVQMHLRHVEQVALVRLGFASAQGHDVGAGARPGHVVDGAQRRVFSEVAEVGRSLHVVLAALTVLIVDVERAVVHGKHDGLQASPLRHARIVLRSPRDEVFAVGGGEARSRVVHAEHQSPRAVVGVHHRRPVHALLAAPLRIVGAAQLPHLLPRVVLREVGQMQALLLARRIDEHLTRGVGGGNGIERSLCPSGTNTYRQSQGRHHRCPGTLFPTK